MDLIVKRKEGLYCQLGDFYIDPSHAVPRALITHGHSDHLRKGAKNYLCHNDSVPILKYRLGKQNGIQGVGYNEPIQIGDVSVSFFPAGHILGSSQIRIQSKNQIWVVSGDYKLRADKTTIPFEPITCDVFITESTFALPIYRWLDDGILFKKINDFWRANAKEGIITIFLAYPLGKTQRLLSGLDDSIGPIFLDDNAFFTTEIYEHSGVSFPKYKSISDFSNLNRSSCIIMSPGKEPLEIQSLFGNFKSRMISGWTQNEITNPLGQIGFPLSDHADWDDLNLAIKLSNADRVIVHHGFEDSLVTHLSKNGVKAESFDKIRNISR
ncbi:ligase-associated DNA damage response exonuclease [Leptospira sp. 96542]|nr:ligase-associated DNA damage response exonuclease [Leptospira sp. 96542]